MAYSEFLSLDEVEKRLGIGQKMATLFENVVSVALSEHLQVDLAEAKTMPMSSEKSKSEHIIVPILKEIRRKSKKFTYFSGYTFDVDAALSLTGVCDYLFSLSPESVGIKAPVFCIVEAKNRTLEEGYGQCAAEMYAAYLYNEKEGKKRDVIYGCVTNAYDWVFLKYENNTIWVDTERYFLNEAGKIVAVMLAITQ